MRVVGYKKTLSEFKIDCSASCLEAIDGYGVEAKPPPKNLLSVISQAERRAQFLKNRSRNLGNQGAKI